VYGEGKQEGSKYLEYEALREEWQKGAGVEEWQMSQQLTWLGMGGKDMPCTLCKQAGGTGAGQKVQTISSKRLHDTI
jgi:hypothetical protein